MSLAIFERVDKHRAEMIIDLTGITDPSAVRRPGRVAFHRTRRIGHVARIALLGGHGYDFAPRFEYRASAGRREVRIYQPLPDVFIVLSHRRQITFDSNIDPLRFAGFQIVEV